MKFNKKTAALALTAIMAVGSSNLSVFAADLEVDTENEIAAEVESDTDEDTDDSSENIGGAADPSTDILYGLIYFNEETQMITGYYDDGSRRLDLVIPSEINGVPVLGIADGAFLDWWGLNSVVIEEGIQTIGKEAFKYCELMELINIPSTVTEIGYKAFYGDGALSKVYFTEDSRLEKIDEYVFAYCNLGTFTVPASVNTIEKCAFAGCELMYECIFEGDAPENIAFSAFNDYPEDLLTIYFYEGQSGFTTPYWLGFRCNMISRGTEPDVWNFSDAALKNLGTITSNVTIDDLTIIADSENPVQVKENPRTLDGVTYDYCLSLRGKGNISKRAIKLDVTRNCTISISAASNDDSRSLKVVKEDGTVLGTVEAGKELSIGSIEYTGRVDSLYIYSEKDNVNVYAINVDYK